jgi:short subunit dehydrogenase-like uncharacterized protein
VFGALVSRELAARGRSVTVAGRDGARAASFAATLGSGHRGLALDVRDAASVRRALSGHRVAVHCAGPFAEDDHTLLDACLEVGCHYVDIADDRAYAAHVRSQHARFAARGLTAAYSCSSLPGLSVALAIVARGSAPEAPSKARVTLLIGNHNAKSAAAASSVVTGLGRPIATPQGTLHGFRERERVRLPPPFGPRTGYVFESPEYDLLPAAVGARDVRVLVGFESVLIGPTFSLLAALGPHWGDRTVRALAWVGRFYRTGHSGGVILAELTWADGTLRRAALHAARHGQRLAALPAALVAEVLAAPTPAAAVRAGACTAYELLGAETLVAQVAAAGFERLVE